MRSYLLKREAKEARQQMIQQEIENIEECVTTGFFSKNLLHNLISKVTTPFSYSNEGYTVVTNGKQTTCASVMALNAVNSVLTDKRKADHLSQLDAERRKLNEKKYALQTHRDLRTDLPLSLTLRSLTKRTRWKSLRIKNRSWRRKSRP